MLTPFFRNFCSNRFIILPPLKENKKILENFIRKIIDETILEVNPGIEIDMVKTLKEDYYSATDYINKPKSGISGINSSFKNTPPTQGSRKL